MQLQRQRSLEQSLNQQIFSTSSLPTPHNELLRLNLSNTEQGNPNNYQYAENFPTFQMHTADKARHTSPPVNIVNVVNVVNIN